MLRLVCPLCRKKSEVSKWGQTLLPFKEVPLHEKTKCPNCHEESTKEDVLVASYWCV